METTERIRGIDLRLLRISHELRVGLIAQAAGCSRTYIHRIEAADRPSDRVVTKYLAALREAEAR